MTAAPPSQGSRAGRFLAWLVLVVSVPACLIGGLLALFAAAAAPHAGWPVAPGEIVGVERRSGDDVAPVIRFALPDGTERRITGNVATARPDWRVGDAMGVRYDPAKPEQGLPDTFWSLWLFPLLFGVPALLLLIPASAAAAFAIRRLVRPGAAARAASGPMPAPPGTTGIVASSGATMPKAPAEAPILRPSPFAPTARDTLRAARPGLVAMAVGLAALAVAASTAWDTLALRGRSIVTEGEVVAIERYSSRGSSYAPVFAFRTEAGDRVRVRQGWGSSFVAWSVGERTPMRYDPAAPGDAAPDRLFAQWGGAMLWGICGSVALGLGGAAVLRHLRRARRWRRLSREGRRVAAAVLGVRDWRDAGSGSLWSVSALWREPGRGRRWEFRSLPLSEDPAPLLDGRCEVAVLVHPADPAVYAMQRPRENDRG